MKFKNIDNGKAFDWGNASFSYTKFRDIYPDELYKRLRDLGVGSKGTAWLDIGTGTGILPKNLYDDRCRITGIDIAEQQIERAREDAQRLDMNIDYFACPAENTGLTDNSFDHITAAQCFMYFDRERIIPEIKRLLKKDGRLIKIYMGWLKEERIPQLSKELVREFNPDWLTGSPMVNDLKHHPFPVEVQESFYSDILFCRESWTGRMMATRGVEASMTPKTAALFKDAHEKMMERETPEKFTIRHKIFLNVYKV